MRKSIIPAPPKPEDITSSAMEYLEKWKKHFQNLSPRVKLLELVQLNLDDLKKKIIEEIKMDEMYTMNDFPTEDQIVFVVTFNSSPLDRDPKYLLSDSFLFCFKNVAFGATYFAWDGGPEELEMDENSNTFSLSSYPTTALTWEYITKIITNRVKEIEEDAIPKPAT